MFRALCPLVLASASPRRSAFMESLGLGVLRLCPPEGAEPLPMAGEQPPAFAIRAAEAKLFASLPGARALLAGAAPGRAVLISADTVVVDGDRILGKPRDATEALAMLRALSGREHMVITGCAALDVRMGGRPEGANYSASPGAGGPGPRSFAVSSRVSMWNAPEEVLSAYVAGGEPLDKAGAYAVQGSGAFLVEEVTGSPSNVVGLPMAELVRLLLGMKAIAPCGRNPVNSPEVVCPEVPCPEVPCPEVP